MVIHPRARREMAETTADKQYAIHTCRAVGRWKFGHLVLTKQHCDYVHGSMLGSHRHAPA
jgi:hypothetical protein